MFLKSRLVLIFVAHALGWGPAAHARLGVFWSVSGPEHELKSWDFGAIQGLKSVSSQEKDPASGKVESFKGVLLSQVLEQAMAGLSVERKAQVDLLVLRDSTGGQVLLPRSVVTKYPVLLALGGDRISMIMPWTSKPAILREDLPIENYFVNDLVRIELSNYRERYGSVFLKRRTDPLAMRGEKIFVQNCVGCHSSGNKPSVADLAGGGRGLASDGHPGQVKGVPRLKDKDRRAVGNYLEAYRSENSSKTAAR